MKSIHQDELKNAEPVMIDQEQESLLPQNEQQTFDVSAFRADNRIHVEDGSHFTDDQFVVIHPNELKPENEQRLTAKLLKHYTIPYPHFLGFFPRVQVALSLADSIPVSTQAKEQSLAKEQLDLYLEKQTGIDPAFAKDQATRNAPFDALIRAHIEKEESDPVGVEVMKNATALYLMMNEALRINGYPNEAASYVPLATPDAMLENLGEKLGFSAKHFHDIASAKGLSGIGELLQLDEQTLLQIHDVTELASANEFSNNMITNWTIGHAMDGANDKPVEEVMVGGLMMRVANRIHALREQAQGRFDVPTKAIHDEDRMVAALRKLPPEVAELLFVNGTEFAYTPAPSIQNIDRRAPGALAFHSFAPFEHGSKYGVRQIFVAARGNQAEFDAVLTHEAHHVLYPMRFSVAERQTIDGLIAQQTDRLNGERGLFALTQAWDQAETQAQKDAVLAEIEEKFVPKGQTLASLLGDKSMDTFVRDVDDAARNLDPNGDMLTKYYPNPESRTAELISRYAELKYVRMADHPQMLDLIAPHMGQVYDDYFLPHVREQLAELKEEQNKLPEFLQNAGYPADNPLPNMQVDAPKEISTHIPPTHLIAASTAQHMESMPELKPEVSAELQRLNHGGFTSMISAEDKASIASPGL